MDSMLIVTYSYTGTSRRLAQMLAAQEGWPLGEVVERHPRAGFTGTMRCALDSMLRRHPAVRYEGPDPSSFRTVVLVAPIWMYRLAGPMRSFIADHRTELQRVAVVVTMGSAGAVNAIAEVHDVLGRPPVLSASFTARQVEDGSCGEGLRRLGESLQPGSAPDAAHRPVELSPHAT